MKKKGFTLIELLAVIVILAIIALIAIPLIGNVIEKAKIGALENSVNGLVESANMYYANQTIKGEQNIETTFDFAEGVQTSTEKLEYKGKVYNGKLILHANGETAVCIDDKEHYAYKNKDTDEIISGTGTCLYDGTTGDFSSNSPLEDMKKQVAAATATSDKVLEGDTIYTLNGLVAGTMANKAGQTLTASTVTESGDNTLINIPQAGYYDTNSKISVANSNLSGLKGSKELVELFSGSMTSTSSLDTSGYRFLVIETESYSSGYGTIYQYYVYDKNNELTNTNSYTFIDNNGYVNIPSITDSTINISAIYRTEIIKIYGIKGATKAVKLNNSDITSTCDLDTEGYRFLMYRTSSTSGGYGTQIQYVFYDKHLEYSQFNNYQMVCNSGYFGCLFGEKKAVVINNSQSVMTDVYGI